MNEESIVYSFILIIDVINWWETDLGKQQLQKLHVSIYNILIIFRINITNHYVIYIMVKYGLLEIY